MPKRILVLSASVGAGHLRAAQAVELALRQLAPDATVLNVDVLSLTNAAFRRLYGEAYLDLVNRVPHVLGYFYDLMDRPVSSRRKGDRLRYIVEKLNMRPFLRFLEEETWDVIVNTQELKRKLEKVKPPARHRLVVIGFTDQIDELMAVADLVISKPGGLTTSEALARGAAMAVVNPIPGQESRNSDFLLENGAAIKINNAATMSFKLSELLAHPTKLAQLKKNARRIGHPRAAFDVAQAALDWPKRPKCK